MTVAAAKSDRVTVEREITPSTSFSPMDWTMPLPCTSSMDSRFETYTHLAAVVAARLDRSKREQAKRKIFFLMDMFLSLSIEASTYGRFLPVDGRDLGAARDVSTSSS